MIEDRDGKVAGNVSTKTTNMINKKEISSSKKKKKEIGLFAARIAFDHPTTHERMVFKADPSGEAFDLLEMTE